MDFARSVEHGACYVPGLPASLTAAAAKDNNNNNNNTSSNNSYY